MVENLLEYYERELTFLRRLGGEFSPSLSQDREATPFGAGQV
jgi:type VI protein secretion system component VasA